MDGGSPHTMRRILISLALLLAVLIVIIAAVYAIAFIMLAPMMT
ncbi:hypothetical protein MI170_32180 [Mycolicibacterium goodii]|nr:hypothetical protein [Mycolicibacterium goodii]UVI51790.1 hypothetical protein MI170_32180 [Mycolicibacterium goodii]